MNHILAACGPGTPAHQSCGQYMFSSWSTGGVLLGVVILALAIALAVSLGRRRS